MEKKNRIYQFIESEISNKGLPPTIREIGKKFNISSTNGVRYFLDKLEEEGWIERRNRTARGIKIIKRGSMSTGKNIPLLGHVPAGKPTFSEEYIEDTILIDRKIAKGDGVFAVMVKGDSMIGAGIYDGDIAVVKQTPLARDGEIIVALIDDEVTLKRYLRKGKEVILKPENENYSDIKLSSRSNHQIKIIGTVLAIVRKY